jgi:hypothetical protein
MNTENVNVMMELKCFMKDNNNLTVEKSTGFSESDQCGCKVLRGMMKKDSS